MTRNELNTYLAAVLVTLDEMDYESGPESAFYMAVGCDLERWNLIRDILVSGKLIEVKGNWVSITSEGSKLATKVKEATEAHKSR